MYIEIHFSKHAHTLFLTNSLIFLSLTPTALSPSLVSQPPSIPYPTPPDYNGTVPMDP